jgi:integrase
MGRPSEGFKVRWKRGWAYACFTWAKREYRIALRTRNEREAEEAAAREYAKVVSGERRPVKRQTGKLHDLADLFDLWLESKRTTVDVDFFPTLEGYARRYVAFFVTLGEIDEASGSTYGLARLGQALRTTVLRELSYLRQFLAWCVLHGALTSAPAIPSLPPRAKGIRTGKQRAKPVFVSPDQAAQILALLPEESKTIAGRKWPIRARFAVTWETMLRPETIARLRVPENWRPGSRQIDLDDEDDKIRWGRSIDLSPEAVRLLTSVAPASGVIFGHHVFYKVLKRVASTVLGPRLGRMFAPYDFRHGGAKDTLDSGAPIRGLSYNLGHKRVSTTDKYTAPDREAGAVATQKRVKRTRITGPKAGQVRKPRKRSRRSD